MSVEDTRDHRSTPARGAERPPFTRSVSRWLSAQLDRRRPSERNLLLITAILVGALTGGAAILFVRCIEAISRLGTDVLPGALPDLGRGWVIIVPALGGLAAGPIISRFAREAKGHGVPEVMQALALEGGRIRPRVAVAKIAASSICLGSGGSAGREGPIVQVGATLGSTVAQLLRLSRARVKNLVACGAAAGVAATFNAPIAGVAFAIEVLAGELGVGILSNVVISAVTASVVSRAFLGEHSAFEVPSHQLHSAGEMGIYILLGLGAALVGVAFIRVLYFAEDRFDAWKRCPFSLRPAVGGLLLGLLGYSYPLLLEGWGVAESVALGVGEGVPHVFGSGFEAIGLALAGPVPWKLLLVLVLAKMLATSFTLGSGNSGGVFAPSLFMGAMFGGLFGQLAEQLAPGIAPEPAACALAGMAAVFSAAARAPLTAILIAFEMSGSYGVILPLMASTIAATLLAGRLHPESIYSLKLTRRGVRLRLGRDTDVLDHVLVGEVMRPDPLTIERTTPLDEVEAAFLRSHRHGMMVVDERGALCGIVTITDLERARAGGADGSGTTVEAVMVRSLLTATPEESMGEALERMAVRDVGRMPVVDARDPTRLLGILRRSDVLRAYRVGRLERVGEAERTEQTRIGLLTGHGLVEAEVRPGSPVAGCRVRELNLPDDVLLTTRLRGETRKLLHGEDTLEPGDRVLALVPTPQSEALRALFRPGGEEAS
ncbi:MAG: chloride channel protein [Planctomycetota bacterium]